MNRWMAKLLGVDKVATTAEEERRAPESAARRIVRKGTRSLIVERQYQGVLLTDMKTGHQLFLHRDGVVEVVFPRILCDERSFRVLKIPSRKVPGKKVVHLFCCIKGHWDDEKKRCERGFFLSHTIAHPVELMPIVLDEFLTGELSRRRRRIWERLKEI